MKTKVGKSRDPVKEQFWRRALAKQARCGLSVRAYCQREGLKTWNFNWWHQELARRDRECASVLTNGHNTSSTELARTSGFLPVRVVPDAAPPTLEMAQIEIVLPAGPIVRVTRGFDPQALNTVLSVLEARRC
jgi:transposase